MEHVITSLNLSKQFGKLLAVDKINLNISKGVIHGFVGPNGAGKTTTIKMLIGAMHPSSGSGTIGSFPIGSKQSRRLVGYVPEKATFYKEMTTIEYLLYMGQLAGLSPDKALNRSIDVLKLIGLIDYVNFKPIAFSSGMKKKLVIAQSLLHSPKILILDEPTANLDPESRMFIMDILTRLVKEQGLTIFVSSHILTELELIVDEVTLIDRGKVVLSGEIDAIRNRFKQGVLEISCSNNDQLRRFLMGVTYIDSILVEQGNLYIYTKAVNRFKSEIGRIIYELNLSLNHFSEEKISLDNLYRNVFNKDVK